MDNITMYIKSLEEYKNSHPDMSDALFVRYVYLDLASRFSFNCQFLPFGNSKKRHEIYFEGVAYHKLNESFDSKQIICNSISRIFEIVMKHFGIDAITVDMPYDMRRCPHVYNEVRLKDGTEPFRVDIQEDMCRVQMNGFTPNYGLSKKGNKRVISRDEIIKMDIELGYVNSSGDYSDNYIYLLKEDISHIESLVDRVEFALENIEAYDNKEIGYTDRKWHHVRVLEDLFNRQEIDFMNNKGKIRFLDCYKVVNGKEQYYNCICVVEDRKVTVFMYNYKENKYVKMNYDRFLDALDKGLIIYKNDVKVIEKDARRRKTN